MYYKHSIFGTPFLHFDSISTLNENFNLAQTIATSMKSKFSIPITSTNPVVNMPCPVQTNGYDCGVFCIYMMDSISKAYQSKTLEVSEITQFPFSNVVSYRKQLRDVIATFLATRARWYQCLYDVNPTVEHIRSLTVYFYMFIKTMSTNHHMTKTELHDLRSEIAHSLPRDSKGHFAPKSTEPSA